MNQHELDRLIARYFDGETSLAEERRLRLMLARPEATGDAADEARAVMGVFAAQRASMRPQRRAHRSAPWQAAAAIALIAAVAVALLLPRPDAGSYTAYCDGTEITDRDNVLAFMQADLSVMGRAAADLGTSVAADFGEMSNAITSEK